MTRCAWKLDYPAGGKGFSGTINWVQIDLEPDDYSDMMNSEHMAHVRLSKQRPLGRPSRVSQKPAHITGMSCILRRTRDTSSGVFVLGTWLGPRACLGT